MLDKFHFQDLEPRWLIPTDMQNKTIWTKINLPSSSSTIPILQGTPEGIELSQELDYYLKKEKKRWLSNNSAHNYGLISHEIKYI